MRGFHTLHFFFFKVLHLWVITFFIFLSFSVYEEKKRGRTNCILYEHSIVPMWNAEEEPPLDNKNEELLYGPGTEINPSPINDVADTDTETQTSQDEDPCLQVDHDLVQNVRFYSFAKIKIKITT